LSSTALPGREVEAVDAVHLHDVLVHEHLVDLDHAGDRRGG